MKVNIKMVMDPEGQVLVLVEAPGLVRKSSLVSLLFSKVRSPVSLT